MTEVSARVAILSNGMSVLKCVAIFAGNMLRLMHGQLKDGGYMFLVMPRPCTKNSRYLDDKLLARIMQHVGFRQISRKDRDGAKVIYTLWQKQRSRPDPAAAELAAKRTLREGANRNNFCILLR